MSWLTSPPEHWVRDSYASVTQHLYIAIGGSLHYKRTRTITQEHKGGMTQTCAENLADDLADDTNVTEAMSERANDGGGYRVNQTLEVYGDWELVT
jgi:hypothetical protein